MGNQGRAGVWVPGWGGHQADGPHPAGHTSAPSQPGEPVRGGTQLAHTLTVYGAEWETGPPPAL